MLFYNKCVARDKLTALALVANGYVLLSFIKGDSQFKGTGFFFFLKPP